MWDSKNAIGWEGGWDGIKGVLGVGLGKGCDRGQEGRCGGRKARRWDGCGMGGEMGPREGVGGDGTWEDVTEERNGGCAEIGEGMRPKTGFDERWDGWEMRWERMWEELDVRWDGIRVAVEYGLGWGMLWNGMGCGDSVRCGVVWEGGWAGMVDGMRWGMTRM